MRHRPTKEYCCTLEVMHTTSVNKSTARSQQTKPRWQLKWTLNDPSLFKQPINQCGRRSTVSTHCKHKWSRRHFKVLFWCNAVVVSSCAHDHQCGASCLRLKSATTQVYLSEQCMHQGRPHSCCNPTPEQAPDSVLQESCICKQHAHCSKGSLSSF